MMNGPACRCRHLDPHCHKYLQHHRISVLGLTRALHRGYFLVQVGRATSGKNHGYRKDIVSTLFESRSPAKNHVLPPFLAQFARTEIDFSVRASSPQAFLSAAPAQAEQPWC
jgi:hypothetical protein